MKKQNLIEQKRLDAEKPKETEEIDPSTLAIQREETALRQKETKEAKDKLFMETTIENYSMIKESDDQQSVITKD